MLEILLVYHPAKTWYVILGCHEQLLLVPQWMTDYWFCLLSILKGKYFSERGKTGLCVSLFFFYNQNSYSASFTIINEKEKINQL